MKLQAKASAIFDRTIILLAVLAGILLIVMMLSVNFEVAMRYFLGSPTKWVMDVTQSILLYITFLGTAWVLKREGHVKMDMVINRLKPRTQAMVNIITSISAAIPWLVITCYTANVTWDHFQRGFIMMRTALYMPSAPILVIIPIGSFLLFIQFLRRAYGYLASYRASTSNNKTDLRWVRS